MMPATCARAGGVAGRIGPKMASNVGVAITDTVAPVSNRQPTVLSPNVANTNGLVSPGESSTDAIAALKSSQGTVAANIAATVLLFLFEFGS